MNARRTAYQITRAIRQGQRRAGDEMRAALLRAQQQQAINSLTWLDETGALAQADALDARQDRGVLAGLPLVVKDNIDVAGLPTSLGTARLASEPVPQTAQVIQRLQAAGAIVMAKAGMHELASGTSGLNAARGDVLHPFLPEHVPGGSSSGSAAAVAAGIVPLAIGTDTGASVRLPASFCGLVGFRPSLFNNRSERRYPTAGIAPISISRDTAGLLAHSVRDICLVDSVISGEAEAPPRPSLAGMRLGVPRQHFWQHLDPAVETAAKQVLQQLAAAGVILVEADIEQAGKLAVNAGYPLASYEMLRDLPEYLRRRGSQIDFSALRASIRSPDVIALLDDAATVDKQAYDQACRHWKPLLAARYQDYFHRHCLEGIIFPSVPLPPPKTPAFQPPGAPHANDLFRRLIANCEPATIVGLPCISLPLARTAAGIPVGIELQFNVGQDLALLSAALTMHALFGRA
ncbi:amidase [Affinibrenneria salicis]|uniref:Amidase n=1 Tax=Affinibrenneria salicis TaxID=2590031 RepID=A0A5J5FQM0_9GAMM|nr:amidase family protein [Affinibrenneria salicis]KAA8994989.1 amidase [Affinibrenneria salicis]